MQAAQGRAISSGGQGCPLISHVSAVVLCIVLVPGQPPSLLHFLSCAVHQPSRFGNTDAVVPKVLSMQVHQAWSAAAIAVSADRQGRGGEAVAAEELTPCFEHDGGHFLPASKQVITAYLS